MKALSIAGQDHTWIKALIYGKPGTGKTTFGVTAPKPLILLSERQALTHVRHAAQRIGAADVQVLYMERMSDYRDVLRTLVIGTHNPAARSGPFTVRNAQGDTIYEAPTWPETIVLDSLTDACRLVDEEIQREARPKKGKDGLDVMPERYWQALGDRCEKLIRAFRDVDFHVLFLCLEDDKVQGEGDEAERIVVPSLPMRKLPAMVAAAVNVVGIMARRIQQARGEAGQPSDDAQILFGVRTVGPQHYLLKPYRPLVDLEVPNFGDWVRRIRAAINEGDAAPAAQPRARAQRGTGKSTQAQQAQQAQQPSSNTSNTSTEA